MFERLRFKPHYRVEVIEGNGIVLLSEVGHAILCGRIYGLVAPLIDGQRSLEEIACELRCEASAAEVKDALRRLEEGGYLAEGEETVPAEEAASWWIQNVSPRVALCRLRETVVSVATFGNVPAGPFIEALRSLRVRVGEDGQVGVALTDDYLRGGLADYNREALRSGRPWVLVKPVGCEIWVGPVFQPAYGCWECLAQRLRTNREVEAFLQETKGYTEPLLAPRSLTSATQQIAWSLAAAQVARWVASDEPGELAGKVLTLDARSWRARTHVLVWRPQCPECGDPWEDFDRPAHPIVLASCKKGFTRDGGHRALSPEATLERYEHHVSPITGAVSRLERCGLKDGLLHVYSASHNFATPRRSLKALQQGLRSHSSGKGMTDLQAKVSGLCEALERYSGVFRGDEPRRRARLNVLGEAAIHPNDCMRFSERQYRKRDAANAQDARFGFVPIPFDGEAEIDWSPVWSLTRKEVRFLPTAFCYYHYPVSERIDCVTCSNGNAAGNTLEEAILQGFLELIERDSVALWWYNRIRRPAVDLDSFGEPYLLELRAHLERLHRDLWVLDLTSDLQIPAFAALSRRTDGPPERIMLGFGAHLEPRIGVLRAVTELNQFLIRLLQTGDTDGPSRPDEHAEVEQWLRTATLACQPHLAPDSTVPPRVASDFPRLWTDDLGDDVRFCQSLVERHGLEMLVLDQTRPDIGLPVVKVIVPGLRHFWARFAPGRLYDVPVQLGWLPWPFAEEELNPVPMFL